MNSNVYRSPYRELYLCHGTYKYIKREWKNGQWHYTYPGNYNTRGSYGYTQNNNMHKMYSKAANDNYQLARKLKKNNPNGDRYTQFEKWANDDANKAKTYRYYALKQEATLARQYRDTVKKWESTPISKIQTAYHKTADKVSSLLSKVKNKLVSAFTPKETVRMTTTDPSSGYRSVTVKKK